MTDRFAVIAQRLLAAAQVIAATRSEELRTDPAARWRKASLVWPRFTKG